MTDTEGPEADRTKHRIDLDAALNAYIPEPNRAFYGLDLYWIKRWGQDNEGVECPNRLPAGTG